MRFLGQYAVFASVPGQLASMIPREEQGPAYFPVLQVVQIGMEHGQPKWVHLLQPTCVNEGSRREAAALFKGIHEFLGGTPVKISVQPQMEIVRVLVCCDPEIYRHDALPFLLETRVKMLPTAASTSSHNPKM
jgi:hypothetical protein